MVIFVSKSQTMNFEYHFFGENILSGLWCRVCISVIFPLLSSVVVPFISTELIGFFVMVLMLQNKDEHSVYVT